MRACRDGDLRRLGRAADVEEIKAAHVGSGGRQRGKIGRSAAGRAGDRRDVVESSPGGRMLSPATLPKSAA